MAEFGIRFHIYRYRKYQLMFDLSSPDESPYRKTSMFKFSVHSDVSMTNDSRFIFQCFIIGITCGVGFWHIMSYRNFPSVTNCFSPVIMCIVLVLVSYKNWKNISYFWLFYVEIEACYVFAIGYPRTPPQEYEKKWKFEFWSESLPIWRSWWE
jgi:hypothetical protein